MRCFKVVQFVLLVGLSVLGPSLGFAWMDEFRPTVYGGFQNSHYYSHSAYPYILSQPIAVLPPGFRTIVMGSEIFYYQNGVFYQKSMIDQQYMVVPPPIGALVYSIPRGYQLMMIDGVPYYFYDGVFYRRVLEGYRVVVPPVNIIVGL